MNSKNIIATPTPKKRHPRARKRPLEVHICEHLLGLDYNWNVTSLVEIIKVEDEYHIEAVLCSKRFVTGTIRCADTGMNKDFLVETTLLELLEKIAAARRREANEVGVL